MSEVNGKWGYTRDEECYQGFFDSPEEAAAEGIDLDYEGASVIVGQFREPVAAEGTVDVWFVEDIVERVLEHDDYCFDFCGDWPAATRQQEEELAADIRKVFGAWLDRHNLRPTWGVIDDKTVRTITRDELFPASRPEPAEEQG